MNYVVTWTVDIEADSAREAAQQALDIQRDPLSTAVVFEVWRDGEVVYVDLEVEP